METALFFFLSILFGFADHVTDPVHAGWRGRSELRALECERLDQAEAHRRRPSEVPETDRRAQTQMQIDAVVCHRRIVRDGLRDDRDEAVLASMTSDIDAIVAQASAYTSSSSSSPSPATSRVIVDAFYPSLPMQGKIRSAALSAFAEAGLTTSTSLPLLAADDIAILGQLNVADALPLACQRLRAEGSLADGDTFVGIALLRPQETQLHGGICQAGVWRWLR
ncbi:MAG TPA: hypothetical protein VGF99_08980 [Myxococcota bacterium]